MKLWTKQQQESYANSKICHICKENLENKYLNDKKYCKVRDYTENTEVPTKIPEEIKKQFTCLGENTKQYICSSNRKRSYKNW